MLHRHCGALFDHAFAVSVEDVGLVAMNQNSVFVMAIVGIALDKRASLHDRHGMSGLGKFSGAHRAGEPGPNNDELMGQCSWSATSIFLMTTPSRVFQAELNRAPSSVTSHPNQP